VIVRTTVGGTDDAPTITGSILRSTAMADVPVGATALGGTVYYDSANDQLLMVTHTNRDATDVGAAGNIWSCVGIAKSTDWGATWAYLGDVVTPGVDIDDPDVNPNTIGSFSTYVIDTDPTDGLDYIVVFHADQRADATKVYQSASRCLLSSFLAACDADTAPTFAKWSGFGWSEPGLTGEAGELYGISGTRCGEMNHVSVMAWPDRDGYLMVASETAGSDDTADAGATMEVRFSAFGNWYEIDSYFEGRFLESVERGAFAKTIQESRDKVRVMFDHGYDPQIGNKSLGTVADLREDADAAVGIVDLFDTSYNRDLIPGLRADTVWGFDYVATSEMTPADLDDDDE
jgi:HK97 family phage prohead protease